MKFNIHVKKSIWLLFILVAVLLVGASMIAGHGPDFTRVASHRTENKLSRRVTKLEKYMSQVLDADDKEWPQLKRFPYDMVIYKYVNDSLQSWYHQFTLDNDDISRRVYVQRFFGLRYNQESPLIDVDSNLTYMNMGPNWYVVKSMEDGAGAKVIGGVLVKGEPEGSTLNGVNPRLRLSDRFSVYPVSGYSGGSEIKVEGRPLFKIVQENAKVMPLLPDSYAIWIAVFLVLIGVFLYLFYHNTIRDMWLSMALLSVFMAIFYLMGSTMDSTTDLFSPTIYAGSTILYSLGALLILNLLIVSIIICAYISRRPIFMRVMRCKNGLPIYTGVIILALILLAVYINYTLKSVIMNSNITLELYKINILNRYTAYVYLSYISLIVAVGMLVQMLRPSASRYLGWNYDVFSRTGRTTFAALGALYLILATSMLGFKKEENRVDIMANRLAVDRDLSFEIRLRGVERSIANDPVIPALIQPDKDYRVILNRISENYIGNISKDYDVDIFMFKESDTDPEVLQYFNDKLREGVAIADTSRFRYSRSATGKAQYTGVFSYYKEDVGLVHLLLDIESKSEKEDRGYAAIISSPRGRSALPRFFSYGKYLDDKLVSYQGDYAYPTVLSGRLKDAVSDDAEVGHVKIDNYIHFVRAVSDDECIVVSRKKVDFTRYMVAAIIIFLFLFFALTLAKAGRHSQSPFEKNYYKQRINTLLYLSLTAVLVAMATISVFFVYRRNEANLQSLMTNKVNTIQSLVEADSRYFTSYNDYASQEFGNKLADIGNYTNSDISLYTLEGKVFKSTYPEIFERMAIGSRIDDSAFKSIMRNHKRYYIHRERVASHNYYAMYAPVFNNDGKMLAIVGAPYTDSGLDFKAEAIFHSMFIIAVFMLLLLLTRVLSGKVVDKMFRPLVEMGRRMSDARTGGLEYIFYDREDEISTLVQSYNRMVHDLSESSKQAAQIERDRAWSEMARQVAHEIKNPLTPIKLQIQRIIRLKAKNDPDWQEKFDDIVPIIMDSIAGLADTADEFSTFAKLYSQEPTEINLDKMLQDQVALFDDKDNITFEYIGLQDVVVEGPKPQINRVFVNLLTNAVQAVENQQKEDEENGLVAKHGVVRVSLRNSTRDGFYDIVFEDNGPGVKDENRGRLFTPNFTTKSSGTGLGLAICKNIIERCGGEISYSKSFSLQGACFTVRYPKK